jgi:hypothetical protein
MRSNHFPSFITLDFVIELFERQGKFYTMSVLLAMLE